MSFDWIVLVPPLIVLTSAALTRRVIASLLAGIASAAAIHTYNTGASLLTYLFGLCANTVSAPANIKLFAFLAVLGTVIELMTRSGGVAAYTAFVQKFVSSKRQVENSSLGVSCVFFLDDYLNSMTTGAIMRPLTDAFAIPRVKLAYLINSMASPLCPLIPLSSWAATIILYLQTGGIADFVKPGTLIQADPFIIYLTSIPFIFYAIFSILGAFLVVNFRLSFGPMKRQECIADESGNLFGGKQAPSTRSATPREGSLADFFVPIGSFILSALFFLLYTGNSILLGGNHGFVNTLRTADTMFSLLGASLFTLLTISVMSARAGTFSLRNTTTSCVEGLLLMKGAFAILFLSFAFGSMINNDLHSGAYLASLISRSLPLAILPLTIFLLATITTASTGSSWGTMAILIPLTITTLAGLATGATPVAASAVPLLFPSLGALIAGSVAGAHLSPITEATVVSAMGAGAYHLDHVKTMVAYALPTLLGASTSFLLIGMTHTLGGITSYAIALLAGIITMGAILFIRSAWAKNKKL
ncbi:MAG: hypothetical protein M1549_03695 [Candidatus Dependentiae bacterium]|nr:hypothetical protein [Candidatus Dependentiae bacterium]